MAHQRMAVVDASNKVINVIVYDPDATWTPPEGTKLIQDGVFGRGDASPGGVWDGSRFLPEGASAKKSKTKKKLFGRS